MLLVVITKITDRSYETSDDSFDMDILGKVGLAVDSERGFSIFGQSTKAEVDVKDAVFAVVRGNPGCQVIDVLERWKDLDIVVILHPKGNNYDAAMAVLKGRETKARVYNWWSDLEAKGRVLRFTSGGDRDTAAFTMKKAVWRLARSCNEHDVDAFEGVLRGVMQSVRGYCTGHGISESTGTRAVEAATKHVADSFREDEGLWTLLNREIIANESADALHFVMNRLVPIVTDLETWEDGRVDDDYMREVYTDRIRPIWEEVTAFLQSRYNGKSVLGEKAMRAFGEIVALLHKGECEKARQSMKTWTSQSIREAVLGRLHKLIPSLESERRSEAVGSAER